MKGRQRVVIYARTATASNPDRVLEEVATCRLYCEQQGREIVLTASDAGVSGRKLERAGLTQVLNLVASGGVDILLADGAQRFARNADLLSNIIATCNGHGVRLCALGCELSGDPFSEQSMVSKLSAFADAPFKL